MNPSEQLQEAATPPTAISGGKKGLLIAVTALTAMVGTASFFLWLSLKVFGAILVTPNITAIVCAAVSWALPGLVIIGCFLLLIWLFKVWKSEPAPQRSEN
ncbi:MAG: hypothetical protein LBI39_03185 [Puniceicoccales bacterium]|nr:hypothetical protein [Puniceicoccales bacterium]